MKISKSKLKQIIKEELAGVLEAEGGRVVTYNRSSYGGWDADFDNGEDTPTIGEMILSLMHEDVDFAPMESIMLLKSQHAKKVQGGMQNWDSDVFEQYYNVNVENVIKEWARLKGYTAQKAEEDEDEGEYTEDYWK